MSTERQKYRENPFGYREELLENKRNNAAKSPVLVILGIVAIIGGILVWKKVFPNTMIQGAPLHHVLFIYGGITVFAGFNPIKTMLIGIVALIGLVFIGSIFRPSLDSPTFLGIAYEFWKYILLIVFLILFIIFDVGLELRRGRNSEEKITAEVDEYIKNNLM